MNSEPKPFASLSSSLLARKGQAKPAMRPQGFAGFGFSNGALAHDDLGWNDMGHDQPVAPQPVADIVPIHAEVEIEVEQPVVTPVHHQQQDLARKLNGVTAAQVVGTVEAVAPVKAPVQRAAAGSKAKAAFTLRLDPERHLKLRLVCAVEHRSAQQVVISALDAFLANATDAIQLAVAKPAQSKR